MRVVSLAIWACRESKLEARTSSLSHLIIQSSTLTHHDILGTPFNSLLFYVLFIIIVIKGVAPAFSVAYLLMNWLRTSKTKPFYELVLLPSFSSLYSLLPFSF